VQEQYNLAKSKHGITAPRDVRSTKQTAELSPYEAFNRLSSPCEDDDDDLQVYMSEKAVAFGTDALQWWANNEHRFPVLKHLAFTYLAAPLSSADNERLFSKAGNVVNEERPHTQAELAEAVQCLRSWHENKLM
jgi:hypothetical protein